VRSHGAAPAPQPAGRLFVLLFLILPLLSVVVFSFGAPGLRHDPDWNLATTHLVKAPISSFLAARC
jgi:ABC-type spermidine/putrescine transport system permease subunit II